MSNAFPVIAREQSDRSNLFAGLLRRHFVPPRNDGGFLLLEVLISIVIIATTLVVINRAFSTSLRAVGLAGDYLLADCVLEDKIFDIQINDSFLDVRLSDTVELGQQEFFYSMDISPADITVDEEFEEPLLKEANLSVNWGEIDSISRLKVSTYVWEEKEE